MTFQPHQPARMTDAEREAHIADCDGVTDCYFSAAGALARQAAEGKAA